MVSAVVDLSRESFWEFCRTLSPDYYTDDKIYLMRLCETLQAFYERRLININGDYYKKLIIEMPPQHGKFLKWDTPILTTKGFKNHIDLQKGDIVFGKNGQQVQVEGNTGGYFADCVSVNFATGDNIICAKEHEWLLECDLGETGVRRSYLYEAQEIFNNKHRRNPYIRADKKIETSEKDLPIDPYILGVWLGDGDSKDGVITVGTEDIGPFGKYGNVKKYKNNCYRVRIGGLRTKLKEAGVFKNKHIPETYFTASEQQRLELLKGLMDTDGTVNTRGSCEFTQKKGCLAKEVYILLRTLGYKPTLKEYDAMLNGRYISKKERVIFIPDKTDEIFKLQRKQNRIYNKTTKDRDDKKKFFITSVTPHGKEYGNCIQVEGGLYLAGYQLIMTHNSRTLTNFCAWVLGQNQEERIITGSYNDDLAQDFSRYTRDIIQSSKINPNEIIYSDIFPDAKIKRGDASYRQWSLEGQFFNYKGTGVGGSVTGKGATIRIIDDPVKSAEVAYNESALDKLWLWYTGTWLSRRGASVVLDIICNTPWAKKDITGRLLEIEPEKWYRISMPVIDEKGKMLCNDVLDKEAYEDIKRVADEHIFAANYLMQRLDIKGRLYTGFNTYSELPENTQGIVSYTDTADEGKDYLCTIVACIKDQFWYVIDVEYTQDAQEITEPATADIYIRNGVTQGYIESNNGGRAFARNVKRIIAERGKRENIRWFHQSKNKIARILTQSNTVQKYVLFPEGWKDKWPAFYTALTTYQKEGKNNHDDAPDTITGLVEKTGRRSMSVSSEAIPGL